MGEPRIGIGGWTFPPWRESFYPAKWPQSRELEYAASRFRTLEINATFYGRQSPKSWEKWAATVPDGFQFTIKASRFCVSRAKLGDGAGHGAVALVRAMRGHVALVRSPAKGPVGTDKFAEPVELLAGAREEVERRGDGFAIFAEMRPALIGDCIELLVALGR